ncbi:MAG: GTPase Era [Alphaproteobacteria bacterium]|nr:MAG: GTPase Era [Alphaproteobacteria bacterium]
MKIKKYKCGVILLTGFPNAGKSTLLNNILNNKISIVSHKVQTTKEKISGVINLNHSQLIFTDTPGIIQNRKYKTKGLSRSIQDEEEKVDLNLFIYDLSKKIDKKLLSEINTIIQNFKKNYLVLNKIDLVSKDRILKYSEILNSQINFSKTFMISAKKRKGLKFLLNNLIDEIPERHWKYNGKIKVTKSMNYRISEITREKIFNLINKEIPYLVKIKTKIKNEEKIIKIYQEILVNKDSQKSIIIGKNGEKIKMIGTRSRIDIEKILKKKVFLDLTVKKMRI